MINKRTSRRGRETTDIAEQRAHPGSCHVDEFVFELQFCAYRRQGVDRRLLRAHPGTQQPQAMSSATGACRALVSSVHSSVARRLSAGSKASRGDPRRFAKLPGEIGRWRSARHLRTLEDRRGMPHLLEIVEKPWRHPSFGPARSQRRRRSGPVNEACVRPIEQRSAQSHGRDDDDPAASCVLSHDIVQSHGRVPQLRCTGADAVEARARW